MDKKTRNQIVNLLKELKSVSAQFPPQSQEGLEKQIPILTEMIDLGKGDTGITDAYVMRGVAYWQLSLQDRANLGRAISDFLEADKLDESLKSKSDLVYLAVKICAIFDDQATQANCFARYADLLAVIEEIRGNLFYKPAKSVAHYTSLYTLRELSNNDSGRFRLYNSSYMNDRAEGRVFFEMLGMEEIRQTLYDESINAPMHSAAYIGSFAELDSEEQKDKLLFWRHYGKHDNKDAAGACLVFKDTCFADKRNCAFGYMTQLAKQSDHVAELMPEEGLPTLYTVQYEAGELENNKENEPFYDLKKCLEAIQKEFLDISERSKELKGLARELLDSVRFLFKKSDYQEEKEIRIVDMHYSSGQMGHKSDNICSDINHIPPRFYLEMPENFRFSGVILGPQAQDLSWWRWWITEQNPGIDVEQSKIPYGGS